MSRLYRSTITGFARQNSLEGYFVICIILTTQSPAPNTLLWASTNEKSQGLRGEAAAILQSQLRYRLLAGLLMSLDVVDHIADGADLFRILV